jgi:phage shock protein PspC (stress-responsive transcriptional regulator)
MTGGTVSLAGCGVAAGIAVTDNDGAMVAFFVVLALVCGTAVMRGATYLLEGR